MQTLGRAKMSATAQDMVTIKDIEAAADRLADVALRTPLLESPALNRRLGARVLLKPESLQRTGSFKFRGAYNKLSSLPQGDRRKGVVAWSSGNHAQGVAAAARILGISATIVMPADAPALKIENTRNDGAEVVLYDRRNESREAIGMKIAEETGRIVVRPYDDPQVMAGQGTVALEVDEQCQELGVNLDAFLVCCSGGGLSAGCAVAMTDRNPSTEIYTVEPDGFDDAARSLAAGHRVKNDEVAGSICDALLAATPGELTFPILRDLASGGVSVSDEAVRDAMRYAFQALKLVLEPGGACALAAVLSGRFDARGRTIGIVLSGGNVSPQLFSEILNA